ncbi:hypothetical protein BBJ28_00011283 [Nothophytophthora sp. Chile5]|nr:hypothetical protein BBJ28_00011283 [Nothophytophthora sp. Chile5]
MTHELKRPLLFNVQPTRPRPPLGVVSQQESARLQRKPRGLRRVLGDDGYKYERDGGEDQWNNDDPALPAGALPVVRSPRPTKTPYIPSPSKTPTYFRWKPQPAAALKPLPTCLQIKPLAPRVPGPSSVASPGVLRRQSSLKVDVDTRAPVLFDDEIVMSTPPSSRGAGAAGLNQDTANEVAMAPWQQESTTSIETLASPGGYHYLFDGPEVSPPRSTLATPATVSKPATPAVLSTPSTPSIPSMPRQENSRVVTPLRLVNDSAAGTPDGPYKNHLEPDLPSPLPSQITPSAERPGTDKEANPFQICPPASEIPALDTPPSPEMPEEQQQVESTQPPRFAEPMPPTPSPPPETQEENPVEVEVQPRKPEPVEDFLATPIVLQKTTAQQPQERVFTQHVLRGFVLRKYLHVSNIARKLRETEQQILRVSVPLPAGGGGSGKPLPLPIARSRKASLERVVNVVVDDGNTGGASSLVLRRLSSVDKAISQTAHRMRLMSGVNIPALAGKTPSKGVSLRTIGEGQQLGLQRQKSQRQRRSELVEGDEEDVNAAPVRARLDPTSAHILRICRHVIAKRAVKSFLRQEMSVITQTEVALRDDAGLQHRPGSSRESSRGADRRSASSIAPSSNPRLPIKALPSEVVESLTVYLKEGDQHMTVDELFLGALLAETEKNWKRAILLASACVVVDREFILAALLRARCCRRLGLWTQAIKDLSHALLLRPGDQRLFLLRACLHSKTGDVDNALADVNRALALHPQYTDALLLRADIFHQRRAVAAALQDLTTVLTLDRSCWRAYYDRATLRLRAIEGEEQRLVYHSEHMRYEELLAAIIQDYVNALHKGCTLVEVVESVGDLTVRLLEFTGDVTVLRQVIQNLTRLLHLLVLDPSSAFSKPNTPINGSGLGAGPPSGAGDHRSLSTMERELLVAAIHAQRGRLYVLSNDKANALEDFDHAVVMEYHYPVAHFYRGAFATLMLAKDSSSSSKDAEAAAAHHANNMQHLSRCLALDPTISGAYTVRGALHLRDLRFNNALQDFKAAVATDPTLSEVWLQIALVYLNHYHDAGECIKACSSALANDASLSRALFLRGEAYTRQGNLTAALREYTRLTRVQPNDRWAHLLRGRLQLQLKLARPALYSFILFMEQGTLERSEARPAMTPAGGIKPVSDPKSKSGDSKRALLLCGRAFQLLSRFQSAVHAFELAVAENPTSENLVLLSESLHSLGDTENSLRISEKVVNADPSSFRGYVRRAQLLVSVGQLAQAMVEYDKALALAPKEGRVYYERGIVQMQLYLRWRVPFQLHFASGSTGAVGLVRSAAQSPFAPSLSVREVEKELGADAMLDETLVRKMVKQFFVGSITDLSKCIRLEPLLADAYVDRGELNALGEEYGRAFRDLESAIERQPKCIRAHVSLGVLKCQFAAYAAAIDDFDKAIKCEPPANPETRACALFDRGVAYQKLELWSQAEKSYNQSIALLSRGRDVAAHRNRAIVRCYLGSFEGALEDLGEVQHSAPDDDELHGALGFALLQLGRYEDAAKHFAAYGRLGRDTYVDSGNAHFNLATKYEAHLEEVQHAAYLQRARRFYLRAVRLHPSNVDVRLNLANCLRKENALRPAIVQCEAIATAQPLNHACLESKALALFQLPERGAVADAVACMNEAVRTCVASSSNLGNIFYAFTSGTIHRNALERKTINRGGARRHSRQTAMASTSPTVSGSGAGTVSALLAAMETPAPEVLLTGSHEQTLALYMLNRGIMLETLGNLARARQDYSDAMHFDPSSVHVHVCLGTLSLREGKFEQSSAEFARALELDPSSGVAHLNLGVVCLCRNELLAATTHFDAAIALLPRCSYAYANKAVALARCGDTAGAELHFKRAIEELPSRKEFYLARGKIVAQQKRLHDAMVDFSTALFLGYDGKL